MTLNQLFWKLTEEKFTLHEVNFGGAAKIPSHSLLSIMLHITPWTLMLTLHIRLSVYLVLTNFFIISDVPHYIRWNQHNTICIIQVKVDVPDTCGATNDMFVLWNPISAISYEDREYCLHIFLKPHALVN